MNNSQYYLEMIEESNNEMNLFEQNLMSGNIESIQEGLFLKEINISKSEWDTIKKDIIDIYKITYLNYIRYLEGEYKNQESKILRKTDKLNIDMYNKQSKRDISNIEKKLEKIETAKKGNFYSVISLGCNYQNEKKVEDILLGSLLFIDTDFNTYFRKDGPLEIKLYTVRDDYGITKRMEFNTKKLIIGD